MTQRPAVGWGTGGSAARVCHAPNGWDAWPRPAVEKLPTCPSWCSGEHAEDFAACRVPIEGSASEPIWGLVHHRRVEVASAAVEIFHVVHVRIDGSVVESFPADISWEHGEAASPAAASDMASALLEATTVLMERGGAARRSGGHGYGAAPSVSDPDELLPARPP